MEMVGEGQQQTILLLDESDVDRNQAVHSVRAEVPQAEITAVGDLKAYERCVQEHDFDIVVMPCHLIHASGLSVVHELRMRDRKPAILVVAADGNPGLIAGIFNVGVDYCLIKDEFWTQRMGPAVRSLLRQKKRERSNDTLVAKLCEANALLEAKNQRLDEFTKTVAHDIRGPLGGIAMRLEYMLDVYGADVEDRCRQLMQSSLASSRRLIAVVQAMYEYAKLGSKSVAVEQIDLPQFLEEVISDLHLADTVDLQIGIGELPLIWGDPNLLRKVFFNIIGNAVKYADKTPIVVNIGAQGVVHRSLADFVEIFIQDNGPGIPWDEQTQVFDMFSQGAAAEKSGDGTGIGLAVVKKIIELHLGGVAVESEPGHGARFILSLPMDRISLKAQ